MPLTSASGSQSSDVDHVSRRLVHQPGPPPSQSHSAVRPPMPSHPANSPTEGPPASAVALPSLRHISRTPPTPSSDRRPGNPLGVQNILNPQDELTEQRLEQRGRRRSVTQMESPSPIQSHVAQSLPSISRPNSVDSTQEDHLLTGRFAGPGMLPGRHMHSPRSPKAVRASSTLNKPTGTIFTPFLSTSDAPRSFLDSGPPSISAPPAVAGLPFQPRTAPTPPPGMPRPEFRRRPSASFPQSGNASPNMMYSPFARPSSIASGSQYDPSDSSQPGSYMNVPSSTQSQDMDNSGSGMEAEPQQMIAMAPTPGGFRMMTIKSQTGQDIHIPVDDLSASRVADEKRKRNAGASARFRARRKEKEREASTTIQNLQQQLREAGEDVDYYRSERDFWRTIVFQQPGAERNYTRPVSPRLRRVSTISNNPQSVRGGSSGESYSGYSESGDTREPERNVRRRTSSYHPPPGPAGGAMNGSGPPQQGFAGTVFPSINPPPPPPQNQGHPMHPYDARDQRPLPEMAQPPPQRPGFRNPFTSESGRYENRNWAPSSAPDTRP